jgi:hypothetical protein
MIQQYKIEYVYPLLGGVAESQIIVKIDRGGLLNRIKNVQECDATTAK